MTKPPVRTELVAVRLSPEERLELEKQAKIADVSASTFIRNLIVASGNDPLQKALAEAAQTAGDLSRSEQDRRAALLALTANSLYRSLSLRDGLLSGKAIQDFIDAMHKIEGLPIAHVKVTEESKSLNAHVHTTQKSWEEMVDESHGGHPEPGRALPGSGDAGNPDRDAAEAGAVATRRKARPADRQ